MSRVDAGRELCRLLADPTLPYREMWERRGAPYRGRALNQASVNKVVASFLVDAGVLAEFEEVEWPRSRRDWVRTRLAGDLLTHLELEVFMNAFAFEIADRERLRHLLDLGEPPRLPDDLQLDGLPDRSRYALDRSVDEHVIGPTGLPTYRRTSLTMRALADDVDAYLYLVNTGDVVVEVSKGGSAGSPQQVGPDVWAVVITLDSPLRRGQLGDLTYESTLEYATAPPPLYRRTAPGRDGEVEIVVEFDAGRLPRAVYLSTWATVGDISPTTSVVVELDHANSVAATWAVARSGLVGFSWEW